MATENTNTSYDASLVPGDYNPFVQDVQITGQPSLMPAHLWYGGKVFWSLPILAYSQLPWPVNDLNAYFAAPVPHSGTVVEPQPSGGADINTHNSDIPYMALKAPKF